MMRARFLPFSLLASVLATALLFGDESQAQVQVQYDSACRTNAGICQVNPAPLNSACRCYNDPGRVVPHPVTWRNVCRTSVNQCTTPFGPPGAPCRCGNQPGRLN